VAKEARVAVLIDTARPYRCEIIRGIAKYARQQGHWTFSVDPLGASAPVKSTRYWECNGIVAYTASSELCQALRDSKLPVVLCAASLAGAGLPKVRPDDLAVGQQAAEHFLQRGFRHFGYLGSSSGPVAIQRGRGFERRLAQAGFTCATHMLPSEYLTNVEDWEGLVVELQRWLSALPKPVGVLATNDITSRRLTVACRHLGLPIPEEVATIGVDNEELVCEFSDPPLSSVDPDWVRVGFEAAKLLDVLMAGQPPPAQPILVTPAGVVARQSTDTVVVENPLVAKAIRFIRDNAAKPVRIADLVKALGVSRRSLEQRFKASLGRGPAAEIRRAHVEQAKKLLIETPGPISAVAKAAGFSNAQSLCVIFRREVGLPPTVYRKQARTHRAARTMSL
jgi:LacI family transcriptional regulator